MKDRFDEMTRGMAQSVTRRAALKKFGLGLAGVALACFGLADRAEAGKVGYCVPTGGACSKNGPSCCHGACKKIIGSGIGYCQG
jgi:hypothetical protein